jgi:hypothetical protein
VTSDDPTSPALVPVSGFTPSGHLVVTGSGHFGPVDFGRAERVITLHNTGECDLHVGNVGFAHQPHRAGCRDCDGCGDLHGCTGCGDHEDDGSLHSEHEHRDSDSQHEDPEHRLQGCCGPFTIVSNPFPATVRPGSSLPVHLRFTATCSGPACCELVMLTDDPEHLSSTVFVTGQLHRTLRSAIKCWAADELQELLRAGSRPC